MQQAVGAVGSGMQTAVRAASRIDPRLCLAWILRIAMILVLFVVFQTIQAEGAREMFSEHVSMKLSKTFAPLTGWMARYNETRKLDMANGFSMLLLLFTYASFEVTIYRLVRCSADQKRIEHLIVAIPALVLMVVDSVLFVMGIRVQGSFESFVPAGMLAMAYDAMLVLFSSWIIYIERKRP